MVVGMTDPSGTEEYNLALGERRANAAVKYLGALGLESKSLKAVSVGEESASADESTWSKDRRAEPQERHDVPDHPHRKSAGLIGFALRGASARSLHRSGSC